MSTLFIIRHGQASFATDNYDRLSEVGKLQADRLATYFSARGLTFHHAYSGTLERQVDTALPIITHMQREPITLVQKQNFNEFDFRPAISGYLARMNQRLGGRTLDLAELCHDKQRYQRFYDAALTDWINGVLENPEMEVWQDFKTRVGEGLRELLACSEGNVLLTTSGGVIGVLMQLLLELSDRHAINLSKQLYNSSITQVSFDSRGQLFLRSFNTLPHLDASDNEEMMTYR